MKRNRCLNFFKGLACFGIVLAHERFPGNLGIIMWNLAHWIVLFFYMISGYYAYYPDKNKTLSKLPPKMKHILKITLVSILVYFIFLLFNHIIIERDAVEWLKSLISLKNLFDIVVLTNFETTLKASHLWYLPSLIYCYLLLYYAIKCNKTKVLYYMVPILIVLRILIPYMPGFNWNHQQNFLLGALPYFVIGYYYAAHKEKINKITDKLSNKQIIAIIIFSLLLRTCQTYIDVTADIFEIGAIVTAISIFAFAQKNPDFYISNFFETVGTKYSLFIYVMHILIAMIIKKIFEILLLDSYNWYPYVFPILVPIFTLISAIIWDKIFIFIKKIKLQNCQ